MPDRSIPKVLTPKDWDAKKGALAKLTTETGIGAALVKLKPAYDKISWDVMDPDLALAANKMRATAANLDALMKRAKAHFSEIEKFQKELASLITLLEKTEVAFKKNRLIPPGSLKHVTTMKKTAQAWFKALGDVDQEWAHMRASAAQNDARIRAEALQRIKPYFPSLKKFAADLKADPKLANYDDGTRGFHQNVRGLGAALAKSGDQVLVEWKNKIWNPMAQDDFKPTKDSEIPAKVDQVMRRLAELEKMV